MPFTTWQEMKDHSLNCVLGLVHIGQYAGYCNENKRLSKIIHIGYWDIQLSSRLGFGNADSQMSVFYIEKIYYPENMTSPKEGS